MSERVLLVEDDLEIGEMVKDYLELEGFRIVHAQTGEEALRIFDADPAFALILLDLMLPKLNH